MLLPSRFRRYDVTMDTSAIFRGSMRKSWNARSEERRGSRTRRVCERSAHLLLLIVACAAWTPAPVQAEPAASSETTLDAGLRIINSLNLGNCGSCHALPGQTGARSTFGPSLEGVGRRHDRESLSRWVTDPRLLRPNTLMPAFGTSEGLTRAAPNRPILTAQEIEQVVNTLLTWR